MEFKKVLVPFTLMLFVWACINDSSKKNDDKSKIENHPQQNDSINIPKGVKSQESDSDTYFRGLKLNDKSTISLKIENPSHYIKIALGKYYKGDKRSAILDFDKAIQVFPKCVGAYYGRAVIKTELGDSIGAIKDYDEAIRLDSTFPVAYHNRGVLKKLLLKDAGEDLNDQNEAIKFDPLYVDAYLSRATIYIENTNYKAALKDYNTAITINPQKKHLFVSRAVVEAQLNKPNDVILDCTKEIELDSNDPEPYYIRGLWESVLKQYSDAVSDFSRAIKIKPDFPEAYLERGKIELILGIKMMGAKIFIKQKIWALLKQVI